MSGMTTMLHALNRAMRRMYHDVQYHPSSISRTRGIEHEEQFRWVGSGCLERKETDRTDMRLNAEKPVREPGSWRHVQRHREGPPLARPGSLFPRLANIHFNLLNLYSNLQICRSTIPLKTR